MAVNTRSTLATLLLFVLLVIGGITANAQTGDVDSLESQARVLSDAQKMTEALPLYEKLVKLKPDSAEIRRRLAFALLGQAANTTDMPERRRLRIRAREEFVKANQLGEDSQLVKGMIEGMPLDGSEAGFSDNANANKLIQQGEAAFSSGKMDDALRYYQDALKADPRCYHAALFAGDVNMHKGNFPEAEVWYQKAIAIDPHQETAYRYSATPLMKQEKYDQARERYIEAYIVAPYNRLAMSGIIGWGNATRTSLGHPKVDVPEIKTGPDGKSSSTVNISPLVDDGSLAWMSYVVTREAWRKEKFAKQFPKETTYRHSLAEEADALRSVVSAAKALKSKNLNSQIAVLAKMDQDGVLESFILLAIPDAGIAQDHAAYLRSNRAQLRKYVSNYVIAPK